jgi:hypothetical protein
MYVSSTCLTDRLTVEIPSRNNFIPIQIIGENFCILLELRMYAYACANILVYFLFERINLGKILIFN